MIDSALQGMFPVASWLLLASLKSTAIIALVLLVRWLFARWLTPQGRYALWFAVVAGLTVPFGMHVPLGTASGTIATPAPQAVAALPVARHELPIVHIGTPPVATDGHLDASSIVILCWMLGIAVLSVMVACNVRRYARLRATATGVDGTTQALARDCLRAL
jgi:beta-lactamase regulating signal transducer with metallopeptidase domain